MDAKRNGFDAEKAPMLKGWLTASQVATELKVARQSVNRMIHEGRFKTLHRLGERPVFVVRSSEVAKIKPAFERRLAARRTKR